MRHGWHNCHFSRDKICRTTLGKIFCLLGINRVAQLNFSQQFETLRSLPNKIFLVECFWRCCSSLRVEASLQTLQEELLSVNIGVRPEFLLHWLTQDLSPRLPFRPHGPMRRRGSITCTLSLSEIQQKALGGFGVTSLQQK